MSFGADRRVWFFYTRFRSRTMPDAWVHGNAPAGSRQCWIVPDDLVDDRVDIELSMAADRRTVLRNMSTPQPIEELRTTRRTRRRVKESLTSAYGVFVSFESNNALIMTMLA